LAKPNYSFEKRQRELAKKRKKEEKAAKKAAGGGADELTPNEAALGLAAAPDAEGAEAADSDDGPADDRAPPAQP